ncbi:TKL protein kinase [Podila verticillata NRRL 6337]|nr:TKL protein kinase [Podila verticillata NRRL 6337]
MNEAQQHRQQYHQQQQQQRPQQRPLSQGPLAQEGQGVIPDESDEDRMRTLLLNDDFTRGYQPSFDVVPSLTTTPTPAHATVTGDRNGDGGSSPSLANQQFEGSNHSNYSNNEKHIRRNNSCSHYQSTTHYRPTTSYRPSSSYSSSTNLSNDMYAANGSTPVSQNSHHNSSQYHVAPNTTFNANMNPVRTKINGVYPIQTSVSPRNSYGVTPLDLPVDTPVLSTTQSRSEDSEEAQEARSPVDASNVQDEVNGEELLEDFGEESEYGDTSDQEHFTTNENPAEQTLQQQRQQHKHQEQQYQRSHSMPPASAPSGATNSNPRGHHHSASGNAEQQYQRSHSPMPPASAPSGATSSNPRSHHHSASGNAEQQYQRSHSPMPPASAPSGASSFNPRSHHRSASEYAEQQYQRSHSPMPPASTPSDATSFTPRNRHRSASGSSIHPTPPPEIPMPPLPVSQEPPGSTEIETVETLKRERTRILERRVINGYRQIKYRDISNVQPLKRGGFGEIHTAEWSRLKVVLKRGLVEHAEGVEQFEQELEILKRVHDFDFIVTFYGVTEDPRTKVKCMVMKHCTNGNLCSFLEKNHTNLTWAERYRLSIEIAKGLEFLHKSGFHHRDLHSGNILLDDKRTAMICDFGLSRSSNKSQTTDLTAAVGVASFLAPERFPIKRPVYTASCDVYSLGVVFWHISSGRIPFAKRLREPALLKELMEGHREDIVPGTPKEYRDMLVKCWDAKPSRRLKLDVVIAILQTLMAKPSEPIHQVATGFMVPSQTASAALPVPPDLGSRMAALERASNTLNRMVFNIKDLSMKETVNYIDRTRAFFRDQHVPPQPYSSNNPPQTPIYLCPLVGDLAALSYYLSRGGHDYNPINESSEQTGDTALHLACLFLESPLDTIKVLVELGADINLENLQGYTPLMILVSSNTQYCYEALKYFVMRGARIPAYIRAPITPMNSAQIYALNLVNESRVAPPMVQEPPRKLKHKGSSQNINMFPDRLFSHGRPLIHVVAAMQDDHRIMDCLCDAGLDPAVTYGGETALVAAAAHLKIKNMEWLLNHDLDLSTEVGIQRAIKVVKVLYCTPGAQTSSASSLSGAAANSHSGGIYGSLGRNGGGSGVGGGMTSSSANMLTNGYGSPLQLDRKEFPVDIRDLGKFSWAGVTISSIDSTISRDMVGPVLNLLEQWTGNSRIAARKEVALRLKVMYNYPDEPSGTEPYCNNDGPGATSQVSIGSAHSGSSTGSQGSGHNNYRHSVQRSLHFQQAPGSGSPRQYGLPGQSQRKNQRHLIFQILNEREKPARFW